MSESDHDEKVDEIKGEVIDSLEPYAGEYKLGTVCEALTKALYEIHREPNLYTKQPDVRDL